ncbi:MAG TPA: CxxxxCH/CxxCH domain-containing protein [Nitrospirota bacterium]|nr:CxxxxCH/CxxCH domain-containing protein [Nitrospirota bacterium]
MSPIANYKALGFMLCGFIVTIAACSSPNTKSILNPETGKHSVNWIVDHRITFLKDRTACTECHGSDLKGGISGVSCFSASFGGMTCHANGPSGHPAGWASPDSHGAAAKSASDAATTKGFSTCQACHGSDFMGGLAALSCLNTTGCHGATVASPHSPAPWRGGARTHTTTNTANAPVCGLCHWGGKLVGSYAPLPLGAQPGCFNNTLCHDNSVVPHAVPFTDPTLHGPLAKSDLIYCEGCHAAPSGGGPGSNPRYNVPIGNLTAGCESSGCHAPSTAHPTQWRGFTATAPGGHRTAGNMANACVLCHGATLGGGAGPACSTCHTAGSPLTLANCTSCHSSPPSGATAPNRTGAHPVHDALADVVASGCDTCHNGGGNGTANHAYGRTSAYLSFLTGYNAKSGAGSFNATANTCANVSCHGGQTTPNWLTGTIDVNTQCTFCHASGTSQYNSFNSGYHSLHVGFATCTECHDTTKLATVHFSDLNTPAMTNAYQTLLNALSYTGTGGGTFGTCTLTCHGETHSNRNW